MAKDSNPFVAIGASLGGIYLVIVLFFLLFAKEQSFLLVSIVWAIALLGIALGFFAFLAARKK